MDLHRSPLSGQRPLIAPFLLVIASFAATPAFAQVDVQPLSREDPPEGWSGSLTGDLSAQTGNTDFVQLGVRGRVYEVRGQVTTMIVGNGGLGFLGRSRFSSSGLFHYRKTYRSGRGVWPEWYAQANYDRSQLLKFRTLVGAGVRTPVAAGRWGEVGMRYDSRPPDGLVALDARLRTGLTYSF